MEQAILLLNEKSAAEMAEMAVSAVVNGSVDPIKAHINVSRMEAAIKLYKDNEDVRRITLDELAKYGKTATFGDCKLEQAETGVKYDYSGCNDSTLADLYDQMEALKAKIKAREDMLKHLQPSGAADPETGEIMYPPVKRAKPQSRQPSKRDSNGQQSDFTWLPRTDAGGDDNDIQHQGGTAPAGHK